MDKYNELVKLLKSKGIEHNGVDIYNDQPHYYIGVNYFNKYGNVINKYSKEYTTLEAAAVELLEYFEGEF